MKIRPTQEMQDFFLERTSKHIDRENINDMTDVDIAEMIADWEAMSQELGGNTKEWADKNIGRWNFNKHQKELIYKLISTLE